ncbi:hypothetical protein VKT23_013656 [Stygiomarasmius scandens]|uniref:Uncharacterized protein n=1 Tax=Marasmiellus scandens TaxID=2682957 RepID=A0ABR1J5T1_9AGAR
MVNPFVDDQAYESDDNVYDDADTGNGTGAGWNDEDDPEVHDEDCLVDSGTCAPQPRVEAVTDRLLARYVHDHSSRQATVGTDTVHGEELDGITLRRVLCAEEKQIFWRIKCKPGSEMELVFEIMRYGQTLTGSAESPKSSSLPVAVPIQPLSSAARALRIIREYALTQDGEPKTVADELERILGVEWSVEWTRLIDAAGLEPGDNDIHAALTNVDQNAAAFLPISVLQEANCSNTSSPIPSAPLPSNSTSHSPDNHPRILSAFCVPTVSGFVYLEGQCDDIWIDWFMQRSTIVKTPYSKIWIEPVECEDIGILLDTPVSSIHVVGSSETRALPP